MTSFANEKLEFSMKYKGIQSATCTMSVDVQDFVFNATWRINTKPVFNLLFKIRNTYQSEFSLNQCRILKSEKKIVQKNIHQNLSIKYDWENLAAISNVDSTWQIPSQGCYDLLSMIYKLRTIKSNELDSTRFIVDIESQIWNVHVSLLGNEKLENDLDISNVELVELTLLPYGTRVKRKWKTDLLNNRISRPNAKVQIWLGPFPQRLPLKMRFGPEDSGVEMNLNSYSKNRD